MYKGKAPSLAMPKLPVESKDYESLFKQPKSYEEYKEMMREGSDNLHRKVNFKDLEIMDWANSSAACITFFCYHEMPKHKGIVEVYVDGFLEYSRDVENEDDWFDFEDNIFHLICGKCHPIPKIEWDNNRHIMILYLSAYHICRYDKTV